MLNDKYSLITHTDYPLFHDCQHFEIRYFFLYHFIKYGAEPTKLRVLAQVAFAGEFSEALIGRTLETFLRRFFQQQFKRSCVPDGPKVGSVGLSPRGDWRMPSDACATLWLKECEEL